MLLYASFVVGTVVVNMAFSAFAVVVRISGITGWAAASGSVVTAVTFRISCAWISENTRIDALAVVTLLFIAAFIV